MGITNLRFHDLRHTFSSHYVMSGGDLISLKKILGHSSMRMVERYSHLNQFHIRKQINNMKGKFKKSPHQIHHHSKNGPKC
jgi:site-specific recombinase XerD